MPGFRPRRRNLSLTATPTGHRSSALRGYDPLYLTDLTQDVPNPGTEPGSD